MKTVYKYGPLPIGAAKLIKLPEGAQIVSVGCQAGGIFLWAFVDTEKPEVPRAFFVAGTGWDLSELPAGQSYLWTVQAGEFVWHVFGEAP